MGGISKDKVVADLCRIFFKEKAFGVMNTLITCEGDPYLSMVANQSGCTFSHVSSLLKKFEKAGLVEVTKGKKTRSIKLTGKGKRIGNIFRNFEKEAASS